MEFLHTRNLEAAARTLAGKYDRVFIRNKNVLLNPIRMRRSKFQDLQPYVVMNSPAWDSQLDAWNRRGGLIVYYRSYCKVENVAAHQAQIVCECPLSIARLEEYADATRETVVIYRPPRWDEHHRCIADMFPEVDRCRAVYDAILRAPLVDGYRECSDEWLGAQTGLTKVQLPRVRRTLFRKRDWGIVVRAKLRMKPDDRTLAGVYDFIDRECPKMAGVSFIDSTDLSKHVRHWKVAMRALERCGSVGMEEALFLYRIDELGPNFGRIERINRKAQKELAEVIAFVESLPELTLPESPSHQSRFQERQSLSRFGG